MREASTELLVALEDSSNVTDLLLDCYRQDPSHAVYARQGRQRLGRTSRPDISWTKSQPWPKA